MLRPGGRRRTATRILSRYCVPPRKNPEAPWKFAFATTAPAIPAEVKEKMFNPFFTTKPAGEGTGLGLSMSHDIIAKQHDGTIDVETEPGQFTELKIVLPRTSPGVVCGG